MAIGKTVKGKIFVSMTGGLLLQAVVSCKATQTTVCEDPKSQDCPVVTSASPAPATDESPPPAVVTPVSQGSVLAAPNTSRYNGSKTSLLWDATIRFQLESDDSVGIYRDTAGTALIAPQPRTAGEQVLELSNIDGFNGPTMLYAKSDKETAPYVPLGMIGAEPVSFALPGTNGVISAIAKDTVSTARGCTAVTPCIYMAGNFTVIAGIKAKNIAMYRTSDGRFEALGQGVDQNSVMALTVSDTGDLYVGGDFYGVNGGMAYTGRLARWNGTQWSAVGAGAVDGPVFALLNRGNALYVAGSFTAPGNKIVKYDLTTASWSQFMGDVTFNQPITELAWDPVGNKLVVAGMFTLPELYVARYDATDAVDPWKTVVTSTPAMAARVTALAFDTNGDLFVGGDFSTPVPALFKIPVSTTSPQSCGSVPNGTVTRDLAFNAANQLYAVGTFGVRKLVDTSGTLSLETVGDHPFGDLRTMLWLDAQKLLVGGIFETNTTYSKKIKNAALWDGAAWQAVGFSKIVDDWIKAIHVDTTSAPQCSTELPCLDIGGWFGFAGSVVASKIAHYETSTGQFSAISGGMPGGSEVSAILREGPNVLFAGGSFSSPTPGFAGWFNGGWKTVNDWLIYNPIFVLTRGLSGDILGGGLVTTAGGQTMGRIFGWDRSSSTWNTFGGGFNGPVSAIAVDQKNNRIYAGGSFTLTGGQANIALWNQSQSQWDPLGAGLNGTVRSLVIDSMGVLYAGGDFIMSGTTTLNRIARWDGVAWTRIGSDATQIGANAWVGALAVDSKNNLYAGGEFSNVDGVNASKVAKWDGLSWAALEAGASQGVDEAVVGAACDPKDQVYFTGYFKTAGGKIRPQIVKYIPELDVFY